MRDRAFDARRTQNVSQSSVLGQILKKLDYFGAPIPSLNISGHSTVKTKTGGLLSFIIILLTLGFALLKLQNLLHGKRPSLVSNMKDYFGKDVRFTLSYEDSPIAFAADKLLGDILDDPRYFKWVARMSVQREDAFEFIYLPTRPCTEEHYENFYEQAISQANNIEKFKASNTLTCIDFDGFDIYGTWVLNAEYSALEVMLVPCGTKFEEFEHEIRDDCIWDKDEVL